MEKAVVKLLEKLELAEAQTYGNMTVFPLCLENGKAPEYLTLKQAMEKKVLTVEEVDEGGSVPELRARNKADSPIMLIDGEELIGAKQNRIVNLTILLKKKAATRIPVSCVEQGRWSYQSRAFADSDEVAPRKLRARKVAAVSENMEVHDSRASNQGEVWDSVEELQSNLSVGSATSAMKKALKSY
ncbi:ARPP-1 family domain-containing protein [Planctomycetota bacterium]